MGLSLYNTLSRQLEPFSPLDPTSKHVRMYCCGPTIHDYAHIGNFRTFVLADFLRRYLEFRGYTTTHVMNITDVEDKIIRRVRETGATLRTYTAVYESAFLEDHRALNCLAPHHLPRATESIPGIVELIGRLEQRGIAYRAGDGSVYFSITKYCGCGHRYGQLFPVNLEEMRPGERVSSDEYAKESVADFALWKARVPEDGDVFWESPWGQGRPGWHIECSAMSMGLLGPSFDLHLGGEDLVFPHHEDEIAQSEGAGLQSAGQPFVKHWVHGAFLLVEGRKMSKSLGNYYTLRDLLARGFSGREIRYLLLTAHYRDSFNFTTEGLLGARTALERLDECARKLAEIAGPLATAEVAPQAALLDACTARLDEDLNVSAAWAEVFDWVRETNRKLATGTLGPEHAAEALAAWNTLSAVFGLRPPPGSEVPEAARRLADERDAARKAKDFKRSDALRAELLALGWTVEDTPKGWKLKPR
ncbi:MAG: cysteine--tRNA ligase [Verrucomicrobiales bacterium]|nr:cysteine--tRNA ligase [Verrucomicrobiales bacterium]